MTGTNPNTSGIRSCADTESFVRGGPALTFFWFFLLVFLVDEGRQDPNTTICRPSSAGQQNVNKWRFAGEPMMTQHLMLAW